MKEIPGPVGAHIGHPRIRQSNRWVSNVHSCSENERQRSVPVMDALSGFVPISPENAWVSA
jgi:hypothetical protein